MKQLSFILSSLFCLSLNAQETKLVKAKTSTGDREEFYVLKSDPAVKHGTYMRTRDKYVVEKGYYKMGKRDSIWEESGFGRLYASGPYKDDQKNGIWKTYRSGEVASSVNYVNGNSQPEITYYEGGKPIHVYNNATKQMIWVDTARYSGEKVSVVVGNGADTNTIELPVDLPAIYVGGNSAMSMTIMKNLKYPAYEIDRNIQGTVYVRFTIDTAGVPSDFRVVKSVSPGLDKEALRVVSLLTTWSPAVLNGRPIPVTVTKPVKFTLN